MTGAVYLNLQDADGVQRAAEALIADGQRLAVPVCPTCAAVSVAYQEAMGVGRG